MHFVYVLQNTNTSVCVYVCAHEPLCVRSEHRGREEDRRKLEKMQHCVGVSKVHSTVSFCSSAGKPGDIRFSPSIHQSVGKTYWKAWSPWRTIVPQRWFRTTTKKKPLVVLTLNSGTERLKDCCSTQYTPEQRGRRQWDEISSSFTLKQKSVIKPSAVDPYVWSKTENGSLFLAIHLTLWKRHWPQLFFFMAT